MIQFNVILPLEFSCSRHATSSTSFRHAIAKEDGGEGHGAQPLYQAHPAAGGAPPHKGGGDRDQGDASPGHRGQKPAGDHDEEGQTEDEDGGDPRVGGVGNDVGGRGEAEEGGHHYWEIFGSH